MALTGLSLTVVLQLWRVDPYAPPNVGADTEFSIMVIKNVLREGWVNHTPHLGAPFGQQLYDFPVASADVLHLLVIKGIGLLTDDPALVMNCVYRLSFFLVAASAFFAFRMLKVSPPSAAAASILYSFLPYHFLRGGLYGHPTLAAYYAVPLVCALAVRQLGDEPLLELRRRGTRGNDGRHRLYSRALALTICVVVALSGAYYAVFALILLAFTGLARAFTLRSVRPLLSSFVLVGVTGATLTVALLPNLAYTQRNGANPEPAARVAAESEIFGLKIVSLLLPTPGHRIAALDLEYEDKSVLPGEGTEALGLLGTAGFIGVMLAAVRRLLRPGDDGMSEPIGSMAILLLFTVLLGTAAGFSAVLTSFGFVQIRAWNRLSVFIGFLALGGVALALDRLSSRTTSPRIAPTRLGLSLLVLMVGVADQTTTSFVPRYREVSRAWRADRSFFQVVERKYGEADVFQLPIMQFPEALPAGNVYGYSNLRGYLHSDSLRWSFGGMKGREGYWQDQLLSLPAVEVVPRVALAGFEALYIDRDAYKDHGAELERQLAPYLDVPLVSSDGRLAVYDLRSLAGSLESRLGTPTARSLAQLVIRPTRLRWGPDFGGVARTEEMISRSAESSAEVALVNNASERRQASFAFELDSAPETPVTIQTGDQSQTLRSRGGRGVFQIRLSLRPGENKIRFRSEPLGQPAPVLKRLPRRRVGQVPIPTGSPQFRVINPRLDEGVPDLAGLLRSLPNRGSPPTQVAPPAGRPSRSVLPPLLILAGVVVWSVVFTAVTSACRRVLMARRRDERTRRRRTVRPVGARAGGTGEGGPDVWW